MQDNYWYRAVVDSFVDAGQLNFFCPDFGFSEVIDISYARRINERLQKSFFAGKKFLSVCCVLEDWKDVTRSLTDREVRNLRKLLPISEKEVSVRILDETEDGYVVRIPGVNRQTVSGKNLEEKLQEEVVKLREQIQSFRNSKR